MIKTCKLNFMDFQASIWWTNEMGRKVGKCNNNLRETEYRAMKELLD